MNTNCQMVVFSNRAYNAIISESFAKNPLETGGILLGHVLDNGVWIVMEVLPPGINCIFQYAYFEYDEKFVNYLAQSVADQYKIPLDLLGLWHRHPGNMDFFSSTDDGTNLTFAKLNPYGVISGIVNIDPQFRMTMYHLDTPSSMLKQIRPKYEKINFEVGDDIIPEEYFEFLHYTGTNDNASLHPTPPTPPKPQNDSNNPPSVNESEKETDLPDLPNENNGNSQNTGKWPVIVAIAVLLIGVGLIVKCASSRPKPDDGNNKPPTELSPNDSTQTAPTDSLSTPDSSTTKENTIDV